MQSPHSITSTDDRKGIEPLPSKKGRSIWKDIQSNAQVTHTSHLNGMISSSSAMTMTYMEDIIEAIEKRTRMKFTDIPRKSDIQSFDGLRFLHGGFKKGADWLIQEEIQEVKKAMSSLGYPIKRNPELDFIGKDRCKVIYDGHLIIGIYDFIKHTFVD